MLPPPEFMVVIRSSFFPHHPDANDNWEYYHEVIHLLRENPNSSLLNHLWEVAFLLSTVAPVSFVCLLSFDKLALNFFNEALTGLIEVERWTV